MTPTQMDAILRVARGLGEALLYLPGGTFVRVPMPAGIPSAGPPPPDPIRDPAAPPPAPEGRRP